MATPETCGFLTAALNQTFSNLAVLPVEEEDNVKSFERVTKKDVVKNKKMRIEHTRIRDSQQTMKADLKFLKGVVLRMLKDPELSQRAELIELMEEPNVDTSEEDTDEDEPEEPLDCISQKRKRKAFLMGRHQFGPFVIQMEE